MHLSVSVGYHFALNFTESGLQRQTPAHKPGPSAQLLRQKLLDSAKLKPWLNPAWYESGNVTMNSPGRCSTSRESSSGAEGRGATTSMKDKKRKEKVKTRMFLKRNNLKGSQRLKLKLNTFSVERCS